MCYPGEGQSSYRYRTTELAFQLCRPDWARLCKLCAQRARESRLGERVNWRLPILPYFINLPRHLNVVRFFYCAEARSKPRGREYKKSTWNRRRQKLMCTRKVGSAWVSRCRPQCSRLISSKLFCISSTPSRIAKYTDNCLIDSSTLNIFRMRVLPWPVGQSKRESSNQWNEMSSMQIYWEQILPPISAFFIDFGCEVIFNVTIGGHGPMGELLGCH